MRLVRRSSGVEGAASAKCMPFKRSSSSLFRPGVQLVVCRAPLLAGLNTDNAPTSSGLQRKFQRPFRKRRNHAADQALRQSSLGQRRRMNGMAKLMARAGKGLAYKLPSRESNRDSGTEDSDSDGDNEQEEDRPFEPLLVWTSPHDESEPPAKGLPATLVKEMRPDEYGIEEEVTVLKPAPKQAYSKQNVFVPPVLAKWLRPHQREGVQFLYECVMGLKDFEGNGCILADDMGLGKTLQSVTLIYTLLKTGITANGAPTAKRVIVICPCSLVKNWANEFVKWLGPNTVKVLALAEGDRKSIERDIDSFVRTKIHNVLVASYECIRAHIKRLIKHKDCCDLLVCDEAHRLKNSENQTSRALNSLPVKRRVLLTGTPMQNDLSEFYAMVDFTNRGVLGSPEDFRRKIMFPILRGREPDATEAQKRKMMELQNDMSTTVNEFILRRVNTLNAEHLPPKLVQVVCCNLTAIQQNMYQHLVNSKDMQHVLDGKQVNCLASIQMLMKLSNHPSLVAEEDKKYGAVSSGKRAAATKKIKYTDGDEKESTAAPGADGVSKFLPYNAGTGSVHPEWSGKMYVLYRLMKEMRKPGNGGDKIVIVSNYTQTLDLIGKMCRENNWGFCRLDGSVTMKKRQKMVDEFNDPSSSLIAFLLSSKAGGCGLNLIGGNRLVLFDPDWNPAVDKQAAARCWRDGQKKRCFTYRFLATGTVEEKIFQRQLSKEGLQSVVDDKEQVNALSTKDLRNLFKLRSGTPSDTHDKLRCERCKIIHDNAEMEALRVLPKQLAACRVLLDEMRELPEASFFRQTLDPTQHGRTKEEYEKLVKQPIDLEVIQKKLDAAAGQPSAYKKVSEFAKDVNRIFSNVLKVWEPDDEIGNAARHLQAWWNDKWKDLVPRLMSMKADEDQEEESSSNAAHDVLEGCANVHNERGEDYQEQIGMPDEENMRHWSHHHTTDTVDDPVFRAAMRGCDSVSFVFGLEVTWSLIQQRQLEEEERLAMEHLEQVQDLEDDAEKADEEDSKPAAVTTECSSEDKMENDDSGNDPCGEKDVEMEEDSVQENCSNLDENGDSNETGDGNAVVDMSVDLEDGESGGDAVSEESMESVPENVAVSMELASSQPESDSSSTPTKESNHNMENLESSPEDSAASTEQASSPSSSESSPENSAASTEPVSSQSDFSPLPSNPVMEILDSSPENSAASTEPASSPLSDDSTLGKENEPSPNEWACASCTLHNPKSKRKCTACGTKRPPARKKRSFAQM